MVKVVVNKAGYIMYASRAVVPGCSPEKYAVANSVFYKQSCIMSFGWRSLEAYANFPQLALEKSEGIDIVRFLYYGQPVKAVVSPYNTQALDTEADLERIRELWTTL
jgi:3-deoxy-manno-octulosonate cytidylyltransferase (CMP-KDO synthetase)